MAFTAFATSGISGWEADFTLKVMRRNSASRMTVQALYSGLADEFDNSTEMDDKVPMSAQTPTEFSLINGWHIPESSMDYLSGGSIQTSGYDAANSGNADPIYVLTASAFAVNFQSSDIGKTITDGTRTGTLLSYNNTTKKLWVRKSTSGTVTWAGTLTCTTTLAGGGTSIGSLSSAATGEDVWANFYTLGTYPGGTVFYIYQNGVLVPTYTGYSSGALDQLIKTKASGTAIDSSNVTVYARESTYLFDNFTAQASATGGRNPVPIGVYADSNDSGAAVTGPTITFGTVSKDIGDGGGSVNYDVLVDGGGKTTQEVYRWLKQIVYRTAANPGTFTTLTSSSGYFYRYANASYTESKQAPFGTYAGGKVFGARGIWIENVSDSNNRVLIDAAGNTRTPPVSVTATVSGVASGDRVLLARSTGSGSNTINKSQFTLNGTHTSSSTIVVNETVANDIPTSGVIRVGDQRIVYTTLNRGTKTFGGLTPSTVTAAASTPSYVPLIDAAASGTTIASPAMTYVSAFDVVYRVRKYASGAGNSILPFENVGVVGSSDVSFAAVRTVDPVAT